MRKIGELKAGAKGSLQGNFGTCLLAELVGSAIKAVSVVIPFGPLLISGPIDVGIAGLFAACTDHEKPQFSDMFQGFRENFGENFLLGLLKSLFLFLWGLLFIIPGLVKSYSYAMVEYLMAREPDLSATEALKLSCDLMHGNKMKLFLLDLSFIGWILLVILTVGIAAFYVEPYRKMSHTEFFNDIFYS